MNIPELKFLEITRVSPSNQLYLHDMNFCVSVIGERVDSLLTQRSQVEYWYDLGRVWRAQTILARSGVSSMIASERRRAEWAFDGRVSFIRSTVQVEHDGLEFNLLWSRIGSRWLNACPVRDHVSAARIRPLIHTQVQSE